MQHHTLRGEKMRQATINDEDIEDYLNARDCGLPGTQAYNPKTKKFEECWEKHLRCGTHGRIACNEHAEGALWYAERLAGLEF